MRRFLLDTGIAGDFIDRRRGVYEHARDVVALGNRVGIGIPVLAELVYGLEQTPPATATCRGCERPCRPGGSGRSTTRRHLSTAAWPPS